jgi:hypothetical protein
VVWSRIGSSPGLNFLEDDLIGSTDHLLVALAIGVLVGIERGWEERSAQERTRRVGLRTLAVTGLPAPRCGKR